MSGRIKAGQCTAERRRKGGNQFLIQFQAVGREFGQANAGDPACRPTGPFGGDFARARLLFQKALALAEASDNSVDAALVPEIRRQLTVLGDLTDAMRGAPGFGSPGSSFTEAMLDFMSSLSGEDEDDPDRGSFFDSPFGARPSGAKRPGRQRK